MTSSLRLLSLLLVIGLAVPMASQTTTFTATITDPSGVPYAYCNWTATLIDAIPGTPSKFPNGTPVSPRAYSGQCNGVGLLAYSLWDNSKLSPSGSTWTFSVTDSTRGHAFTVSTLSVTGASQNSSASFTAAAPCFSATGVPCGSGTGGGIPAGYLLADNFTGADIGIKTNAAIASLPTNGGTVLFACADYPVSNTTIAINKKNVSLVGCGSGSMLGLQKGSTTLNFAAGVPGIVIGASANAYWTHLEGFAVVGSDTAQGSNDGINIIHAGPVHVIDVGVKNFGGNGFVLGDDTDLFYFERIEADSNWKDGFHVSTPCSDIHLGTATNLSSTLNHGWGYNLQCGLDNTWNSPHASQNVLGAWNVNTSYNNFNLVYVESGTGSSFVINSGMAYNKVEFKAFGQPTTITNNGIGLTNELHIASSAGSYGVVPAQNFMNITSEPGATAQFYSFQPTTNGFSLRDWTNGNDIFYVHPLGSMEFLPPIAADQYVCVGTSCPVSCGSATGCEAITESSTPCTPTLGEICKRADTTNNMMWSINGGAEKAMPLIAPTGTANQAVCLLSSNPPVLGKCTSVVGSGGACTCVSF